MENKDVFQQKNAEGTQGSGAQGEWDAVKDVKFGGEDASAEAEKKAAEEQLIDDLSRQGWAKMTGYYKKNPDQISGLVKDYLETNMGADVPEDVSEQIKKGEEEMAEYYANNPNKVSELVQAYLTNKRAAIDKLDTLDDDRAYRFVQSMNKKEQEKRSDAFKNDFLGETNKDSETGKERSGDIKDSYPRLKGETEEEYEARLARMEELTEKFRKGEIKPSNLSHKSSGYARERAKMFEKPVRKPASEVEKSKSAEANAESKEGSLDDMFKDMESMASELFGGDVEATPKMATPEEIEAARKAIEAKEKAEAEARAAAEGSAEAAAEGGAVINPENQTDLNGEASLMASMAAELGLGDSEGAELGITPDEALANFLDAFNKISEMADQQSHWTRGGEPLTQEEMDSFDDMVFDYVESGRITKRQALNYIGDRDHYLAPHEYAQRLMCRVGNNGETRFLPGSEKEKAIDTEKMLVYYVDNGVKEAVPRSRLVNCLLDKMRYERYENFSEVVQLVEAISAEYSDDAEMMEKINIVTGSYRYKINKLNLEWSNAENRIDDLTTGNDEDFIELQKMQKAGFISRLTHGKEIAELKKRRKATNSEVEKLSQYIDDVNEQRFDLERRLSAGELSAAESVSIASADWYDVSEEEVEEVYDLVKNASREYPIPPVPEQALNAA